ncbi:MAG: hypothetical protein EFT35_05140 [Methanophagales archaeon ANME-1-THS]|nr:MAG: hypothetical protein EFT35_05140 [Methanophagales archaeon ANME-1-THS]
MKDLLKQVEMFEGHGFITGMTGSGKTYFASQLAKRSFQRFIFVNAQFEKEVSRVCNAHVSTINNLMEALYNKRNRIEFIPHLNPEQALTQFSELRKYLFRIGKDINAEHWITLIVDEADIYAPKGAYSDLNSCFQRGRRYGIQCIAISQRPQLVSSTLLNQCRWQVIFLSGGYSAPYFTEYKIPYYEHLEWVSQKYHYIYFDGVSAQEYPPI